MQKILTSFAAFLSSIVIANAGSETVETETYFKNETAVKTESHFTTKTIEEAQEIPFTEQVEFDNEEDFGTTFTKEEGEPGKIQRTFLVTFYKGSEIERKLLEEKNTSPKPKVIVKGLKTTWKNASAQRCSEFKYWHKYENVYMTTYTPQCEGCDAWTSIGLKAGYGIIAVDPKKIPYWTQVCIPGYGIAIAGDTGGAMRSYKGLLIDLGFNSMLPKDKWMTTGRYDMYILNNEHLKEKFYVTSN